MKEAGSTLEMIRQALDCSQEQIAGYLDVSRSLVAAVETHKRDMPSKPELKVLSLIQLILQTPKNEIPPDTPKITDDRNIENYIFKMEQRLRRQQQIAYAFSEKRQQLLRALEHITFIRPAGANDEGLRLFLNLMQASTNQKLAEYSEPRLMVEKLKLNALEAAVHAIKSA